MADVQQTTSHYFTTGLLVENFVSHFFTTKWVENRVSHFFTFGRFADKKVSHFFKTFDPTTRDILQQEDFVG